jgi:uncharacterized membrane protein
MGAAGRLGGFRPAQVAHEAGALLAALAVWAGLAFLILAYGWSFNSGWRLIFLPLYVPAPVAAFVYVVIVRPGTTRACTLRGILVAEVGWFLTSPFPLIPLFRVFTRIFLHFNPVIPAGEDPLFGLFFVSLVSSWLAGIAYCAYCGYWAGRLAAWLRHMPPPPIREERSHPVPW